MAEEWARSGDEATVVTRTALPAAMPLPQGVRMVALDEDGRAERDALLDLARGAWLLADPAFVDGATTRALRARGIRVAIVDDVPVAGRRYECDALVNHNPYAVELAYDTSEGARRFLGPRYALLRRSFREERERERPRPGGVERVLLAMGATDVRRQLERLVPLVAAAVRGAAIDIIVSAAAPHLDHIRATAARAGDRVQFHISPARPAEIMARADLAVSAAGVSALELCCVGVPSALVAVADDQRRVAGSLARRGAAIDLGWWSDCTDSRITGTLSALVADPARRQAIADAAHQLVDGRGAERVVRGLREVV